MALRDLQDLSDFGGNSDFLCVDKQSCSSFKVVLGPDIKRSSREQD